MQNGYVVMQLVQWIGNGGSGDDGGNSRLMCVKSNV